MSAQFLPDTLKGGPGSGRRPGGGKEGSFIPSKVSSEINKEVGALRRAIADGSLSKTEIAEKRQELADKVREAVKNGQIDNSERPSFHVSIWNDPVPFGRGRKSQDMKSIFDEKIAAIKGGPGSGPRPGGGSGKTSGTASGIRSEVQSSLGDKASAARTDGAQTYVSSSSSPNLTGGDRHFIDISHSNQAVEDKHSNLAQEHLDKVAADIRQYNPSAQTYVSSMTSPNMGTRTFMDVKLPDKKKSLSFSSLASNISARVDELKSQTEFTSAIAQLEVALDTAVTNEPINRVEGNIEQADLELEHAASFQRALGLLRARKSLPEDLFERVNENLQFYTKGGPGSGRHKGPGGAYKVKTVRNPAQPAFTQHHLIGPEGNLISSSYDRKEIEGLAADLNDPSIRREFEGTDLDQEGLQHNTDSLADAIHSHIGDTIPDDASSSEVHQTVKEMMTDYLREMGIKQSEVSHLNLGKVGRIVSTRINKDIKKMAHDD